MLGGHIMVHWFDESNMPRGMHKVNESIRVNEFGVIDATNNLYDWAFCHAQLSS